MIRLEQVSKRYPDGTVAVDDLTLTAPTGKITVLVGPSGCGKTTSLRMINRMIEPTSGRILIDDQDTASMDANALRSGIGYVIQHAGLFPHRTIEHNVATVPLLLGWDKRKARERAREMLAVVGLDESMARRYPSQLSGGQQQRVGVARALAADPPVMLMDEPFSAVDPVVREQLQDEFLRLQAELGKTIVFVTHDIDEAIRLGDQVAVLRVGGKLAQVAEPAYLLAHPADDFVADFVGKDRGYRALGFVDGQVRVHDEPTVRLGAGPDEARAATRDPWLLVVDDAGMPQGWVEPERLTDPIETSTLALGGTLARQGGPLRNALDSALSSPSRRGVVVDDEGRFVGTVRAAEVLHQIESAERPEQRDDDGAAALLEQTGELPVVTAEPRRDP
ncbi:ABC transporter ATP-binding protein [Actinomycetota bacterium]